MRISWVHQLLSMAGAACILVAYVGHQLRYVASQTVIYNLLNAIGSGILLYVALRPFQVGFVALELVWALISLVALVRVLRGAQTAREG
jgi:hypothetical protein